MNLLNANRVKLLTLIFAVNKSIFFFFYLPFHSNQGTVKGLNPYRDRSCGWLLDTFRQAGMLPPGSQFRSE